MNSMDFCKVFVGNVPFDCDNEEFSDKFKDIDGICNELAGTTGLAAPAALRSIDL